MLGLNRKLLPPFLAKDSGLESGFMIVHYAAAANLSLFMEESIQEERFRLLLPLAKKTM